ncbi:ER membrane protein SH3 [Pseudogymnoascus sp. 23342-1-I1]|nr:ER membrane protein SH3 [Pseudogymnoascus sp. 23342-1-I1]
MSFLGLKTFDDPNRAPSSGSFATYMIVAPTSFFLGMLFSSFPYDYPLLWTSSPLPANFLSDLETHLQFLHASPPLIPRILHFLIAIGFAGFLLKLFKPSEANLLFDGASLVLYVVGVIVYITNIIKGLRVVTRGEWDADVQLREGEEVIGREDSLKVLAASNTILALVLVGVLVLQAGQWYAERREREERAQFEAMERREGKEGKGKGQKKKQ